MVLVVAFVLRFFYLGYSNYQGDEIKALYLPDPGQSVSVFLFEQRKGPVQFIITAFLKVFDPTYTNELLMRIPFALAGFLSVFFFYKLVKLHFGEKAAFFASLFLATNGFFIAFARIVQYQSIVILFMILALYMFSLKKYYLGFIFWAVSILAHYDGVFIAPFVLYLVYSELKNKHFWLASLVGGLLLSAFYIPFVLSISEATRSYWLGRIGGTGGKISSTRYLFQVYQPIYVLHFYTLFSALGFLKILTVVDLKSLFDKSKFKYYALLVWFGLPAIFLEGFIEIPGTHVYTYLLPLFIIVGLGVEFSYDIVVKLLHPSIGRVLFSIGAVLLFTFITLQSYAIFVDHNHEYPWEDEKFFVWTLAKPSAVYHLSLFGFPYYRHWDEIRAFVESRPDVQFYSCNERASIARYFVPLTKKSSDSLFYVHINRPQSFLDNLVDERVKDWVRVFEPDIAFYDNKGVLQSEVFVVPREFASNPTIDAIPTYSGKLRLDWKQRFEASIKDDVENNENIELLED